MGILQAVLLANALGARHPENEVRADELVFGFESRAMICMYIICTTYVSMYTFH